MGLRLVIGLSLSFTLVDLPVRPLDLEFDRRAPISNPARAAGVCASARNPPAPVTIRTKSHVLLILGTLFGHLEFALTLASLVDLEAFSICLYHTSNNRHFVPSQNS